MDAEQAKADALAADGSQEGVANVDAEDALGDMVVQDDDPVKDAESEESDEAKVEDDESKDTDADAEEEADDGEDSEDEEDEQTGDDAEEEAETPEKVTGSQKRINKLTAQKNEAREKLETAEKRLKVMEERGNANIPLLADYVSADDMSAIKQANEVTARREWLLEHVGVGFEDEGDDSKDLTAKDVAKELAKLDRYSDDISDAKRIYREAKKQQLEDTIAGRLLRLSKAAVIKSKEKKPPPKVKTSAGTSSTQKKTSSVSNRRGQNVERFTKAGGDDDAAIRELSELVPLD